MLVLARKPSEAIKIGDTIIVKVIAIRGGQVKLGIEAPAGVRVIRTDSHPPSGTKSQNAVNSSGDTRPGIPETHESSPETPVHGDGYTSAPVGTTPGSVPGTSSASLPEGASGSSSKPTPQAVHPPDARGGNGSPSGPPEDRK